MIGPSLIVWAIKRTYLSSQTETFRGPVIKYLDEQPQSYVKYQIGRVCNYTDGWILDAFIPTEETPELLRALALWKFHAL